MSVLSKYYIRLDLWKCVLVSAWKSQWWWHQDKEMKTFSMMLWHHQILPWWPIYNKHFWHGEPHQLVSRPSHSPCPPNWSGSVMVPEFITNDFLRADIRQHWGQNDMPGAHPSSWGRACSWWVELLEPSWSRSSSTLNVRSTLHRSSCHTPSKVF